MSAKRSPLITSKSSGSGEIIGLVDTGVDSKHCMLSQAPFAFPCFDRESATQDGPLIDPLCRCRKKTRNKAKEPRKRALLTPAEPAAPAVSWASSRAPTSGQWRQASRPCHPLPPLPPPPPPPICACSILAPRRACLQLVPPWMNPWASAARSGRRGS